VQYAAVRVNKILGEHGTGIPIASDYDYEAEKAIIAKLLEYPDVVSAAARELEPHRVASYVYELAREMNRYYEATPVATGTATELQKAARLGVLHRVSHVFTHGLSILGIEVPSAM
jgi:arginyl-tRNA synthetase